MEAKIQTPTNFGKLSFAITLFLIFANAANAIDLQTPCFIENVGQWPDSVLFVSSSELKTIWFTKNSVHFKLASRSISQNIQSGVKRFPNKTSDSYSSQFDYGSVSATYLNKNELVEVQGQEMLQYTVNFFIGNDPSKWKCNVPVFRSVKYKSIYPGIDLVYYGNGNGIEYDFIVSGNTDPSTIRIKYEGVNLIQLNDEGNLVIDTEFGKIFESKPIVFQFVNNQKLLLNTSFQMHSDSEIGFRVLDSVLKESPLIIDPILTYSTYFGGVNKDYTQDIELDKHENILIVGTTGALFPLHNPFDSTYNGDGDVFLAKISSSGQDLIFSTYIGGSGTDWGYATQLDKQDNVYVAGFTNSDDFPTYMGFDTTHNSGTDDGFLLKFSPNCDSLIFSTFVGGTGLDWIYDLDVDTDGNAYVSGVTDSPDLNFATAYNRELVGSFDAFLTKVSPNGDIPIFGSYLGSSSGDAAFGIRADNKGNVFITGSAGGDDFPLSDPEFQVYNGNLADIFVAQFSSEDSSLVYSIVLGGVSDDESFAIDIDDDGNAYVTGRIGDGFPMINSFDSTYNFGIDPFFAKIQAGTGVPIFTSYLGGRFWDQGYDILVDSDRRIWLTGFTGSYDFPIMNAYDESYDDNIDVFLTCVSPQGDEIMFSTFLGGSNWEYAKSITTDVAKNIYLTGYTDSPDFPTVNPLQADYLVPNHIFISKFSELPTSIEESPDSILPVTYVLSNNYPNPFNPSTNIAFSLPKKSAVQITIYNVLGEVVRELVNERKSAGSYKVVWDGKDSQGSRVSTGVYFYRLVTDDYTESKKMLLLR